MFFRVLVASACSLLLEQACAEPPSDFGQYKQWLETASYEEKKEHFEGISEKFIEEHGEMANKVRLCINLDHVWKGVDLWVDQKWRSVGIRYLDDQRYNDWVVNADHKTAKPWIIMFAYTPFNQAPLNQPTDNQLRNLSCLAKVYGDKINFGFMDQRASEKVWENYDVKLDWGKTTPALIAFSNGKAYPAKTGTLNAQKLSFFVDNFKTECQNCPQDTRAAQSEIGMYLEYAKNEVANNAIYVDTYNYIMEQTNNTWIHDDVMAPYFGPKVGKKTIGHRLIFWIIVPVVLNSLLFLYCIFQCLCCSSNDPSGATKKGMKQVGVSRLEKPTPTKSSQAASPAKSKGKGKREKLE